MRGVRLWMALMMMYKRDGWLVYIRGYAAVFCSLRVFGVLRRFQYWMRCDFRLPGRLVVDEEAIHTNINYFYIISIVLITSYYFIHGRFTTLTRYRNPDTHRSHPAPVASAAVSSQ